MFINLITSFILPALDSSNSPINTPSFDIDSENSFDNKNSYSEPDFNIEI